MEPINAIIIASEITKGMKSVGPKSLLKLKKTLSIIEYQILELKKYYPGIRITISVGFESDKMIKTLEKYKVEVLHNKDFDSSNQVKSIIDHIEQHNTNNLLVIHSGVLFKQKLGPISNGSSSCLYMLDKNKTNFTIGCNSSSEMSYLFFDLPEKWSECVFFDQQAINYISNISKTKEIKQLYTFELINMLIENGLNFNKHIISKNHIMKVSNIKDLSRARVFI
jgi:CTP:phosphocholine cytidylyltransferase-like protein